MALSGVDEYYVSDAAAAGHAHPSHKLYAELYSLELWFDSKTEHSTAHVLSTLLSNSINLTNLLLKKSSTLSLGFLASSIWIVNQTVPVPNPTRESTFSYRKRFISISAFQTNPMTKLSRLTLDECENVGLDLLEAVFALENELSVMRIWTCPKVRRDEQQRLQNQIKNSNLDVYLEWFP